MPKRKFIIFTCSVAPVEMWKSTLEFKVSVILPHKPLSVLTIWPLESLVQKDVKSYEINNCIAT